MLNFWLTQEGIRAIATDPTLQPPALDVPSMADTDEGIAEPPVEELSDVQPETTLEQLPLEVEAVCMPAMVEAGA